jgi:dCMP deaminase
MQLAELAATRSTCERYAVGAIIVSDNQVLATGYNGAPRQVPHCSAKGGCLRTRMNIPSGQRHEMCRGIHAEQNAIVQAGRHGIRLKGAAVYSTWRPCSICMKMIINAGIKTVYYLNDYPDELATELAAEAGVIVEQMHFDPPHERGETD